MNDPTQPDPGEVEDPLGPPGDGTASGPAGDAPGSADAQDTDPEPGLGGSDGPADPAGSSRTVGEHATASDYSGATAEDLVADLERITAERDDYRNRLARNQADFENSRKRLAKESVDAAARAGEALVERLLPVLDACDAAVTHGATEVEPIFAALLGTLERDGLTRIDPRGEAFDPNVAEAVMHEPAADDDDGTVVSDVMRPGYSWKGRVVRPAMVKVRG